MPFISLIEEMELFHHWMMNQLSTDSPEFGFPRTVRMTSDSTFYDLFELFDHNPSDINIELVNGSNLASGDGVNRQFYLNCIRQIIEIGAFTINDRYMNIDATNGFWVEETNIYGLIKLIELIVKDGALPYHISPCLLSKLVSKPLTEFEQVFFINRMDPVLWNRISTPAAEKLIIDDLGFVDRNDYQLFLLDKNYHPSSPLREITDLVYEQLVEASRETVFRLFNSALELDEHLSGQYTLTSDMVYKMTKLETDIDRYHTLWKEFIYSLTETELKNMLLTFTNSLSINQQLSIRVRKSDTDMQIQTCLKLITLNEKLFTNQETLQNLKYLFTNNDTLSDAKLASPW